MSQTISVPGQPDYEFPDEMSDAEISAAIDRDLRQRGVIKPPTPLARTSSVMGSIRHFLVGSSPAEEAQGIYHAGILPAIGDTVVPGKGEEASWGDVIKGSGKQAVEVTKQIGYGFKELSSRDRESHFQAELAKIDILPGALERSQKNGTRIEDDPDVMAKARELGISPQEFATGADNVAYMTPAQRLSQTQRLQGFLDEAQNDRIDAAGDSMMSQFHSERAAPKVSAGSFKSLLSGTIVAAPQVAASIAAGAVAGPEAGIAVFALTSAPQAYEQAKNQGYDESTSQTYALFNGLAALAPSIPVGRVLSRTPEGQAAIHALISKLQLTRGGRTLLAGSAGTVGGLVMGALNELNDKAVLDKDSSLSDALQRVADSGLLVGVMGAGHGALSRGAPRTKPPGPESANVGDMYTAWQADPNAPAPEGTPGLPGPGGPGGGTSPAFEEAVAAARAAGVAGHTVDLVVDLVKSGSHSPAEGIAGLEELVARVKTAGETKAPASETNQPAGATITPEPATTGAVPETAPAATKSPAPEPVPATTTPPAPLEGSAGTAAAPAPDLSGGPGDKSAQPIDVTKAAAAKAVSRSEVTLAKVGPDWTVFVSGRPVHSFPDEAAARIALAQARKEVGTAAAPAAVDEAAQQAEIPTPAQAEAGNYQKGHLELHGLNITIENPIGSRRRYTTPDGKVGQRTMQDHYGYIRGTVGNDGDHVDAFIGPNPESTQAFVIDQLTAKGPDEPGGRFDEHKVMLGYRTKAQAVAAYKRNYQAGWKVGPIKQMGVDELRKWVASGDHTEPFHPEAFTKKVRAGPPPPKPSAARHSVLEFMAAHKVGLDSVEAAAQGVDRADMAMPAAKLGIHRAFRKGGMSFDAAAELLSQYGYPVVDKAGRPDANMMVEAVHNELHGRKVYSSSNTAATERQAKAFEEEMQRRAEARQEAEAVLSGEHPEDASIEKMQRRVDELTAMEAKYKSEREAALAELDQEGEGPRFHKSGDLFTGQVPEKPKEKAKPKTAQQQDLFDELAMLKNALAKAQAAKDAKRNAGQESVETGKKEDLFSQAQHQQELPTETKAQRAVPMAERVRSLMSQPRAARNGFTRAEILDSVRAAGDEQLTAQVDKELADRSKYATAPNTETGKGVVYRPAGSQGDLEDAGVHIGGARKDMWAGRGLDVADLDKMSEGEGADLVTKKNVYSPDYAAMVEAGTEPLAAAYVKLIYDGLAATPKTNTPEGRRLYVKMMQIVRKHLEAVKTQADAKNVATKIRDEVGWDHNRGWAESPARDLLFSVYRGRTDPLHLGYNARSRAAKLVDQGFPNRASWNTRYALFQHSGAGASERGLAHYKTLVEKAGTPMSDEDIKSGFWMVKRKADGAYVGFAPTKEAAGEVAKRLYETPTGEGGGKKVAPVRPHLDTIRREGLPARRTRDATSQDFINDFKFRGLEFGNWAADDERQKLLNLAYDALHDMAEVIGVPPKAMSLNGTMGLALGARGKGRALAHYEPGKLVINMTKINGAGSLAHEWGHALDHYFGELDRPDAYKTGARGASGWYSRPGSKAHENLRPEMQGAFKALLRDIFKRDLTKAEHVRRLELELEKAKGEVQGQVERLATWEGGPKLDPTFGERLQKWITSNQSVLKIREEKLAKAREEPEKPKGGYGTVDSSFFSNAEALGEYWKRPTEMFARSFESFIYDQIKAKGARSQYLVHSVEGGKPDYEHLTGTPYPAGPERDAIDAAYQHLFDVMGQKPGENDNVILFNREPPVDKTTLREDAASYGEVKAIPGETRGMAERKGRKGNVQPAGAVPAQLDIFAATPAQAPARRAAQYLARTAHVQVGSFRSGVKVVRNWQDAAHIVAPLRKHPQEQMLALVLDKDDKPLAVIRHTIGTADGATVSPNIVVAAVARVEGAKSVYFAHNHPSGRMASSTADQLITRRLHMSFEGSGIEPKGMIIVGPGTKDAVFFSPEHPDDVVWPMTMRRRTSEVPITERRFVKVLSAKVKGLESPDDAQKFIENLGEKSGLVLMDNAHRPTAIVPMDEADMKALRGDSETGNVANLLRAVDTANASAYIAFGSKEAIDNIGRYMSHALTDVRPLDGFERRDAGYWKGGEWKEGPTWKSRAETGDWPAGGDTFLAKDEHYTPGTGVAPEDLVARVHDIIKGNAVQPDHVIVAGSIGHLPADVLDEVYRAGGYDTATAFFRVDPVTGETGVYLIADRIKGLDEAPGLIAHELVTHFGLRSMLSKAEYIEIMDGIYRDQRMAVNRRGASEFGPPDGNGGGYDEGRAAHRRRAAEELIAYYSPDFLKDPKSVPEKMRRWLQRLWDVIILKWRGLRGVKTYDMVFVRDLLRKLQEYIKKGHQEPADLADTEGPTFHQVPQTETPEFKRWFGNSRIVTPDGDPKVMYHGTAESFSRFEPGTSESIFLTPAPKFASDFAGFAARRLKSENLPHAANVMPVYVKAEHPFDYENQFHIQRFIDAAMEKGETYTMGDGQKAMMTPAFLGMAAGKTLYTRGVIAEQFKATEIRASNWSFLEQPWVQKALKDAGFDAYYVKEWDTKNLAVFEPSQIKSAIGNRGSFDARSSDIMFAKDASLPPEPKPYEPEQKPGPIFYSGLLRAVETAKREKGTAAEWLGTLRNMGGIKQEELDWVGLEDWLKDRGRVDRAQVAQFIKDNQISVGEKMLGGALVSRDQRIGALSRTLDELGYTMETDMGGEEGWVIRKLDGETFFYDNGRDGFFSENEDVPDMPGAAQAVALELGRTMDTTSQHHEENNGDTKFAQHSTSGGTNYRELLLTLGDKPLTRTGLAAREEVFNKYRPRLEELEKQFDTDVGRGEAGDFDKRHALLGERNRLEREMEQEANRAFTLPVDRGFVQSHWEEPNVLAHVRFDSRTDSKGRKVLHIAEIQSDWHQKGRKMGYVVPGAAEHLTQLDEASAALRHAAYNAIQKAGLFGFDTRLEAIEAVLSHEDWMDRWHAESPEDAEAIQAYAVARRAYFDEFHKKTRRGVPDAPFKTTWPELALKRMLRYAAENGHDVLSWDSGQTQAARYNLSKYISKVTVWPEKNGEIKFSALDHNDQFVTQGGSILRVPTARLADYIGKDLAERALKETANGEPAHFSGLDLHIGGEGLKTFYDQVLPTTLNKYVKKWGGRVSTITIKADNAPEDVVEHWVGQDPNHPLVLKNRMVAHSIEITDEMRHGVLRGQPLFHRTPGQGPQGKLNLPASAPATRPGAYAHLRRALEVTWDLEAVKAFRRLLDPANMSTESKETARQMRAELGSLAHALQESIERLEAYAAKVDQLSPEDQLQIGDDIEEGRPQSVKGMQPLADTLRDLLDTWRVKVQNLGVGALENFIENYFPHYWQDPAAVQRLMGKIMGRRPMRGPASFLKKRTIPTIKAGMEYGLRPLTTNPLTLTVLKLREMQRFVSGVRMMQQFKASGLAQFFPAGKPLPDHWVEIKDAVGRVRQWSEEEGGFIERGRYAMPEDAARVINNHLSGSVLQGFAPAQIFRVGSNALNALQLGFSGFHLGFTTLDAVISKNALGIERLLHGEPLRALAAFTEAGTGPVGAGMNVARGFRLLRAYSNPAGATPEMQAIVRALDQGGGRVKMDRYFMAAQGVSPFHGVGVWTLARDLKAAILQPTGKLGEVAKTLKNFPVAYATRLLRDLQALGVMFPKWQIPFEIAGRVTRASTAIIMEHIVPLQKLGVFSDLAADYLRRNPNASPIEVSKAMQQIWASVDNRLGEMVYDNVFWNRTFKDVLHFAVRAVGWNFGTYREVGGAPVDVLKLVDKLGTEGKVNAEDVGHKIPYVIAMFFTTMVAAAIYQYLHTGKGPQEAKDYFFPRTGGKTKYGTPQRVSMPSYVKDIYEYSQHPGRTLVNKLNPIFSTMANLMQNEDFFGNAITNPDAGFAERSKETGEYLLRTAKPFSLQSRQQIDLHPGEGVVGPTVRGVEPFFGITAAPGYITSPEQLERAEHLRDEQSYIKGLKMREKQARSAGDTAETRRLRMEERDAKKEKQQNERDVKRDRLQRKHAERAPPPVTQILENMSGRAKHEAVASLQNAGMPALAALWEAMPERPREIVSRSMADALQRGEA